MQSSCYVSTCRWTTCAVKWTLLRGAFSLTGTTEQRSEPGSNHWASDHTIHHTFILITHTHLSSLTILTRHLLPTTLPSHFSYWHPPFFSSYLVAKFNGTSNSSRKDSLKTAVNNGWHELRRLWNGFQDDGDKVWFSWKMTVRELGRGHS